MPRGSCPRGSDAPCSGAAPSPAQWLGTASLSLSPSPVAPCSLLPSPAHSFPLPQGKPVLGRRLLAPSLTPRGMQRGAAHAGGQHRILLECSHPVGSGGSLGIRTGTSRHNWGARKAAVMPAP